MIELINGDCMDYMATLEDNAFELAIVDPPYGIGESSNNNKSRSKLGTSKDYGNKSWDDNAPCSDYFIELKRVSKNQIIFGANHFISKIQDSDSSCWIVWDKKNGKNDFADCELAYSSFKTAVRIFEFRWHGMLQENMKQKEVRIHPTQKLVQLYKWLLNNYAKEGDRILDTHLGSGSSAIACHDSNFDMVGIELDEEYYNAASDRVNKHQRQLRLF